jgi:hypothetical protein
MFYGYPRFGAAHIKENLPLGIDQIIGAKWLILKHISDVSDYTHVCTSPTWIWQTIKKLVQTLTGY